MAVAGLRFGRPAGEIDQARQEAGQRLAAAGRRDQQRVAPGAGVLEQLQADGHAGASRAP